MRHPMPSRQQAACDRQYGYAALIDFTRSLVRAYLSLYRTLMSQLKPPAAGR